MWISLLSCFTDSFLVAGLMLAFSICVVGGALLYLPRLIPKDEAAQPRYRRFRQVVILVAGILVFVVMGAVVGLFALTAFGRPPASPAPESFQENPGQRQHQTSHSHQRRAEDDGAGDEYRVVFQAKAHIGQQPGEKHSRREDVKNLLHPLEFRKPAAVIGGRLRAFAGNGGVMQFGGSHNHAILPRAGWGQNPMPVI